MAITRAKVDWSRSWDHKWAVANSVWMNLIQKAAKLQEAITYRRAWRRVRRLLFPLPLAPFFAQIDQRRLLQIQNHYATSDRGFAKYTEVEKWMRLGCERVQDLNLHRASAKRILDLGSGGGFFLFILQQLGHEVLGLDVEEPALYHDLTELFGVRRVIWKIKPFEPLPDIGAQFDWITAFSISFDRGENGRARWGVEEWNFFLEDLSERHLAPAGKMYFALNPGVSGDFCTPELREFFRSRGASVERERIFFHAGLR